MQANRRDFLADLARLAGYASLTAALSGLSKMPGRRYPFATGVASEAPLPSSVVLWTRLIADPLAEQAFSTQAITVRWEIAEGGHFRRIAAKGQATAVPELAHSIHVEASGCDRTGGIGTGSWPAMQSARPHCDLPSHPAWP